MFDILVNIYGVLLLLSVGFMAGMFTGVKLAQEENEKHYIKMYMSEEDFWEAMK